MEQHPDDGAPLLIGDDIKYFINFLGMTDRDLDGMAVVQRIKVERTTSCKLLVSILIKTIKKQEVQTNFQNKFKQL